MFVYEHTQEALEMRSAMDRLFMLVTFGDMIGVPIMPPYYGLRLLPYVARYLPMWKRSILRERQFGDDHEHHLHGI